MMRHKVIMEVKWEFLLLDNFSARCIPSCFNNDTIELCLPSAIDSFTVVTARWVISSRWWENQKFVWKYKE